MVHAVREKFMLWLKNLYINANPIFSLDTLIDLGRSVFGQFTLVAFCSILLLLHVWYAYGQSG